MTLDHSTVFMIKLSKLLNDFGHIQHIRPDLDGHPNWIQVPQRGRFWIFEKEGPSWIKLDGIPYYLKDKFDKELLTNTFKNLIFK